MSGSAEQRHFSGTDPAKRLPLSDFATHWKRGNAERVLRRWPLFYRAEFTTRRSQRESEPLL